MTRDEAKWVLELIRDRYSSVDIDRYSLTDAETDAINMAIEALSADVLQWIPCNEEQPTYDGDYLVTLDFEWGKEIEIGEWFCGEWINPNSHVTVAWMPLPNPWKGERR